ncbi:hypothetical protein O4002_13950 [Providencia stuartii]|uniref:hypothetical protein n=1 Tax=Providencia stuartii TaxID=588 RepID=UPI0024C81858|nr:hypothetical protein [Providencia stuartii]WAZ81490.1 hypothetical protein O4002_13950 [Providencia stuartii]
MNNPKSLTRRHFGGVIDSKKRDTKMLSIKLSYLMVGYMRGGELKALGEAPTPLLNH